MASSRQDEPVNLLALDGGGVRGVSELVILDEIMREIQRQDELDYLPKPCDYFDLIGGTSTGGLIAIMLGRLQMDTEQALKEYDNVAGSIFSRSNWKYDLSGWYKAKAVQTAVEDLVKRRNTGHLMRDPSNLSDKGKAFVCAMPATGDGEPRRFRTYDVGDKSDMSTPIWQAARATTAAPFFFKRMTVGDETKDQLLQEDFVDGAIRCNNPSRWLLNEANLVFDRRRRLNCLVSLGTGTKGDNNLPSSKGLQKLKWVGGMLKMVKDRLTEVEEIHNQMTETFEDWPDTYFRFNVPDGARHVGLSSHKKMDFLKEKTREYLKETEAKKAIHDLVVTLRTKPNKGLTVGHAYRPMKDQLLVETKVAVPRGRASNIFTGRQDILDQLDNFFKDRPDLTPRREHVLCGMGGVGKTQIALKFLQLHEDRFKTVVWLDATDRLTLEQSYRDIAPKLIPGHKGDGTSSTKVKQWLQSSTDDWLLVMDNITEADMSDYIPDGDAGNILYTSRRQDPMSINSIPFTAIEVMEEADAATLLFLSAKEDLHKPRLEKFGSPIVKDLGCLPLAIDQAGAYIRMSKIPMENYLKKFRRHRKQMLEDSRFKGSSPRNQAVYATFEMSYKALVTTSKRSGASIQAREARAALQVLDMICFYYNENVLREMVKRTAETRHSLDRTKRFPLSRGLVSLETLIKVDNKGQWNSQDFDYGADLLDRFSLVKRNADGSYISMHVLVHAWARDRMVEVDSKSKGFCARTMIIESIPVKVNTESYAYRRRLVPHIIACQGYVNDKHDHDILESEYDGLLALVAEEAGMYEAAEKYLQSAIEARKWEYGYEGGPTLRAMSDLARIYYAQGHYGKAEVLIKETLEWREQAFPSTHFRTLSDKEFLAKVYAQLWHLEDAEKVLAEVVDIREDRFRRTGEETWPLVKAKYELASIRATLNDTHVPVQEVEEIVAAAIRFFGQKALTTLSAESALATALAHEGRLEEAKTLIFRVRIGYEELKGPTDVATLRASSNLAGFFLEEGNSIAAEGLWRDVLEKSQETLGKDHPQTIFALVHLSIAILIQGRMEEAMPLLERSEEYLDARLGADHFVVKTQRQVIEELKGYRPHVGPEIRNRLKNRAEDSVRKLLGYLPPAGDVSDDSTFNAPEWQYVRPPC